jgi:hypothetical protein
MAEEEKLEEIIDSRELGEYPEQKKGAKFVEDLANERWLEDLDAYPVRDSSEDPRWALNIVRIWTGIAIFSITFLSVLMILGAILD